MKRKKRCRRLVAYSAGFLGVLIGTTQNSFAIMPIGSDTFWKKPESKPFELIPLLFQSEIRGVVKNQNGTPLEGVSVKVKGTSIGTKTNAQGQFSLNADLNQVLQFSLVGHEPYETTISNQNVIEVSLNEGSNEIEELVVVGYGTQKKVNLTGAVASIKAEDLENRPITNTSTALQGTLPGVTVIQNSGQPGKDNSSIRIRGIGTLNNSNPMYVVDGMIVSTINDIDPNDIASISVLKDAASAAIYGSRAANGVVLVTTKQGRKDGTTLKYDGYEGWQSPTALQEYLPSWEYADLYNKALRNEGKTPLYSDSDIQKFRDGSDPDNFPNTDWLSLFYKDKGWQRNHRVELAGGGEAGTYLMSVGYLGQDGIIPIADFDRYSTRLNLNSGFKRFTANLNLSYVFRDIVEPSNPYTRDMYQIFRQINRIAPFVPNKYSNGYYGYINDGNPIQWLDNGSQRNEKYHTTRAVANVGFQIMEGLKISEVVGYEYSGGSDEVYIKDSQFYNWKNGSPTLYQGPNSQTDERNSKQMVSLQTLLNYDKTFGKNTFNVVLGYSQEYLRYDWTKGYRRNFLNNELWELNAGSPDGQEATGSAYEYALQSYFGRVNYEFDGKYLLELNLRRDGTSRIAKNERWGTYPSFSAGWRLINESFMEGLKGTFSDLKLRAGWGILGNQEIDNYAYQTVLDPRNYSLGGKVVSGVAPVQGANPLIKWESSESYNIGLDMAMLENRFSLTLDYYNRDTYDILMRLPVSVLYGREAPFQNAGKVNNKGIEAQLGYNQQFGDWKINSVFNAAYNENQVVDIRNEDIMVWQNGYSFLQKGKPINSFGGYEVLGIYQTEEEVKNSAVVNRDRVGPGDLIYKDQNGDNKIDGADRVYLGSWTPKWMFGANIGLSWRNFDLGVQFSGAAGVKGYLQTETIGGLAGNTSKPTTLFSDSWDAETNPDGKFPRPLSSWSQNDSSTPSSFWIIDASYLRFKNIQLSYTLPDNLTQQLGLSKVRVYYSGQNLFTISGFNKGFDPEAPVAARAYYPQVKVNTFGLNVSF